MTNDNEELAGRSAIVTGGASGIGFAVAEQLAAAGAEVLILDLDGVAAAQAAAAIGGKACQADLGDPESTSRLGLRADILVNNAGFQRVQPVHEFDVDTFSTMQAVMVEAPFLLIRSCLPYMYQRGYGRIINISSAHGLVASPYKVGYVTAKHAMQGMSKVVALEGGPHGVTSNCINPGYVRTPLVETQIADQAKVHGIPESEVLAKIMLTESAIKRLVDPEEVASLVAWLASDDAGMVTGASYTMDGGWSAR